jgi:hypothetical protein
MIHGIGGIGQLTIDKVDFRLLSFLAVFFVALSSVVSLLPSSFFSTWACDGIVGAVGGGVDTGVTFVGVPRGVSLAPVALFRWNWDRPHPGPFL